jgi:AraC-like DNA-binding protein
LVITPPEEESVIQVDNLEVAQFVYLLLNNEKIRHVIDTITSKVVLILGSFTRERKVVLDTIREELRKRDYLPILFDFEKPASKDRTGTVSTLANLACVPLGRILLKRMHNPANSLILLRRIGSREDEDELSLTGMAQSVELSPADFSRMFRKSTGETPHQFVLRNRIERAKEMLRTAEIRILDVALACGFKTQQHFARVFRRICGANPTEYRYEVTR